MAVESAPTDQSLLSMIGFWFRQGSHTQTVLAILYGFNDLSLKPICGIVIGESCHRMLYHRTPTCHL